MLTENRRKIVQRTKGNQAADRQSQWRARHPSYAIIAEYAITIHCYGKSMRDLPFDCWYCVIVALKTNRSLCQAGEHVGGNCVLVPLWRRTTIQIKHSYFNSQLISDHMNQLMLRFVYTDSSHMPTRESYRYVLPALYSASSVFRVLHYEVTVFRNCFLLRMRTGVTVPANPFGKCAIDCRFVYNFRLNFTSTQLDPHSDESISISCRAMRQLFADWIEFYCDSPHFPIASNLFSMAQIDGYMNNLIQRAGTRMLGKFMVCLLWISREICNFIVLTESLKHWKTAEQIFYEFSVLEMLNQSKTTQRVESTFMWTWNSFCLG